MAKSNLFVCYWDCDGFECIIDCTAWERQSLLDSIAGRELKPAPVNLNALTMRARFNSHRRPEIYTITTEEEITEKDLWKFARENPQELVDLIRSRGKRLYGEALKAPVIK